MASVVTECNAKTKTNHKERLKQNKEGKKIKKIEANVYKNWKEK